MTTTLAIIALAGAVLMIRLGWGGRKGLSAAGWAIAVLILAGMTWEDGAWGLATGITAGSTFALVAILIAAAISPPRMVKRPAASPSISLPSRPEGVTRRLLVFLAVVPLSFVVAQWLAFAVNAAMTGDAAMDANSVSATLFVQPLAWSILMAWQVMLTGFRQMLVPPALVAGLATLIWILA